MRDSVSPLKIGIVGLGRMGTLRYSYLVQDPRCLVQAVCDIETEKLKDFEEKTFTDYRDLIQEPLDAVFVCTPNAFSTEIVVYSLKAGKHVFCEKPPGRTVGDVEIMMAAEQASPGCKLKFGFNHRYHEGIREARSMLESGRFGKILWLRGIYGKAGGKGFELSWRNQRSIAGGGILLDQGIHMLDLFRFFCGDFEEVKSFVTKSFWDIDVEDNAFALLKNSRNQIAMLHSSSTHWRHQFSLEIFLTEGYVGVTGILSQSGSYGRETLLAARRPLESPDGTTRAPREEISYFDKDVSWELEMNEFVTSVLRDEPLRNGTAQDALAVMKLIEKVYDGDESWVAFQNQQESSRVVAPK